MYKELYRQMFDGTKVNGLYPENNMQIVGKVVRSIYSKHSNKCLYIPNDEITIGYLITTRQMFISIVSIRDVVVFLFIFYYIDHYQVYQRRLILWTT